MHSGMVTGTPSTEALVTYTNRSPFTALSSKCLTPMTSSWCQTHTGHMHVVANLKGLPHIGMVKIKVQLEVTTPKYWHKGSSNVQERLAVHLASETTAPSPSSMKTPYKLLDCGLHLRVYVTSLEHQPGGRPTQFLLTELWQASTTKLCRLGFDIPQDVYTGPA